MTDPHALADRLEALINEAHEAAVRADCYAIDASRSEHGWAQRWASALRESAVALFRVSREGETILAALRGQGWRDIESAPKAVYIAARFSRRHEANALAHELKARGHKITSRWVKPETDHVLPTGLSQQAEDSERRRFAMEDIDDVMACDWMISLMEEPRNNSRGGRHIEFGMALGLGKRQTIIGPRETVFHHMDHVEHFDTVEQFLASLPAPPEPKT